MNLSNLLGTIICTALGHKRHRRIQFDGIWFLSCPRCGHQRQVKAKRVAG
jgi:ribosomal protein L37AE/L43A